MALRDRYDPKPIMVEGHLVEVQTLDGCSGAPVFVHEMVGVEGAPKAKLFQGVKLLGVYAGSWDGEPGELLSEDRGLTSNRKVPVGMGVVIPIQKLVDLIRNDPVLKKKRKDFLDRREVDSRHAAPTPDQ